MKILFLISSLGAGGAERVATTLCNAWAARGDQVTLVPTFSGGGEPFYTVSANVELAYLSDIVGSRSKSILNYVRRFFGLRKLIRQKKPDVVIAFLPNVNVAAILSTLFIRVPVICCERRDPSSQPTSRFWELACRVTYRFADRIVVQTQSVANKMPKLYPGMKKIYFIPNPLPDAVVSLQRQLVHGRKILLSLGRLSGEKQVDRIIRAFDEVLPEFCDWDLHIYGGGPAAAQLDAQIEELGLHRRAFLKGPTSEPWKVMAHADAFVLASRYEGFPNALIEAMGSGLPCIAFDCPSGPREITRDGEDARLVPLNDHNGLVLALRNIMGDAALRNLMGDQGRQSILNRFSLPAVIKSWDLMFEELGADS
jgi:GalNAc-alpha-(1->4)-GalNAc-alpha-(1->3)-diNAcBac-PP-undecaprenol alpha-1,4-N-acetyl-D-galactosaminyltransferase